MQRFEKAESEPEAVLVVSGPMTCSLKTDPVIMRVLWDDHTACCLPRFCLEALRAEVRQSLPPPPKAPASPRRRQAA